MLFRHDFYKILSFSGPPFDVDPITNDYAHPYWCELTQLKEGDLVDHFPATPNPIPPPLEDTPLEFVNTVEGLQRMIEELSCAPEIAVDLEVFSFQGLYNMGDR